MLATWNGSLTEDVLSADTFGLMRYLPREFFLDPFLRLLKRTNDRVNARLSSALCGSPTVQPWPSFSVPPKDPKLAKLITDDKNRPKGTVIPDAIISSKKWLLVVESEKSMEVDHAQMFEQYCLARLQHADKEVFGLLINGYELPPRKTARYVYAHMRLAEKDGIRFHGSITSSHIAEHILWLNWFEIASLAQRKATTLKKKTRDKVNRLAARMLEDLALKIIRAGYVPIGQLDCSLASSGLPSLDLGGIFLPGSFSSLAIDKPELPVVEPRKLIPYIPSEGGNDV